MQLLQTLTFLSYHPMSNQTLDYDGDFEDLESDFWEFREDIKQYAKDTGLPLSYVEDEFVVLGEFTPVYYQT